MRTLQSRNVNFHHCHHCVAHPFGPNGIGVTNPLVEPCRDNLPAKAITVDEPNAGLRFATILKERIPVSVKLWLIVAQDDQRDGVVELVVRPGCDRLETLAEHSEVNDFH